MNLDREQIDRFRETGYLMLQNLFTAAEADVLRQAAAEVYAMDREEVVREKDGTSPRTAFAAHCYHEALPSARPPSAPDRTRHAAARRACLHAPVQGQREGGLRRRRLAVAPGLRHLVARRPDAGSAGHEYRAVRRRRHRIQRPSLDHTGLAPRRCLRCRPRSRDDQLPAVGRWTRPRSPGWRNGAASIRPRARPAAC